MFSLVSIVLSLHLAYMQLYNYVFCCSVKSPVTRIMVCLYKMVNAKPLLET